MVSDDLDTRTRELDRAHVFHSWSAQTLIDPFPLAGGSGSTVWDHTGARLLDFSSQLVNVNIGHQHPAVVDAIKAQADLLTTVATGAACHAGSTEPSHVLVAMGLPDAVGTSAVRFSLGAATSAEEIGRVLDVLPAAVARARAAESGS